MSRGERAFAFLVGLLLAALLAIKIGAPWTYIHDDNGAWTQAVATTHLRAGLARTHAQDFLERRVDGQLVPYLHHPPLFPLIVAAAYRLTGQSGFMATRLVPAIFHLLGFVGMFALARRLFPTRPSRRMIALLVYALVPMSSFFGKMPFNEPVGLSWTLWALVWTARYRERPTCAALGAAAGLWGLAVATSWPCTAILFAVWLLSALEWARDRRPGALAVVVTFGGTAVMVVTLLVVQMIWAAGWRKPGLFAAGGHWFVLSLNAGTALEAFGVALDFHRLYFANVPFVLFLIWLAWRLGGLSRRVEASEATLLVLAGSLGAALWAIAFVRQVALHAYGQFWFLPFESLAVADVAVEGWERLVHRRRLRVALATAAIAGTVVSAGATLHYRYSRPHSYAVRMAREFETQFRTHP